MAVLKRVTVAQHERALVWKNRSFERVLEPGVHWIFEPLARVEVQTYDLTVPEFEHPRVDFLVQDAREMVERNFQLIELKDREIGLVFRNEHLVSVLAPGKRQLFWRGPIEIRVELRDISEEFEIDAATARLVVRAKGSLGAAAADAVSAIEVPEGALGLLFVDGEFKRSPLAGLHAFWKFQRTLDELLGEKAVLDRVISDTVRARVEEHGIAVKSVGVKDVILPGEMKTILNQVVEAVRCSTPRDSWMTTRRSCA